MDYRIRLCPLWVVMNDVVGVPRYGLRLSVNLLGTPTMPTLSDHLYCPKGHAWT